MFRKKRIAKQFERLGFFVGFESKTDIGLVRPNVDLSFFEVVQLSAGRHPGGRWGDISTGTVYLGLTPGEFTCVKGLAELECLSEWTPTQSPEDAASWEDVIFENAESRLRELIRTRSAALLKRTAVARDAVEQYLSRVPHGDLRMATDVLYRAANTRQRSEAERLSKTPGLICLPERDSYDLACILFASYCTVIEGDEQFWGQNPAQLDELKWRIQLMASRLYPERGWEMVVEASS